MRLKARKVYPVWKDGKQKVFTMSYDDGNDSDIRLVELMRRHHVKGTFNINSGCFPPEGCVHPKGQVHRRMPLSRVRVPARISQYCQIRAPFIRG